MNPDPDSNSPTPPRLIDPAASVLIIEDDEINAMIVDEQLGMLDISSERCCNGQLGLERWREQSFQLILMDISMPVMGGLEATAAIRAEEKATQRPRTPIIAVTANAESHMRNKCMEVGMDDVLPKPIRLDPLSTCLQPYLNIG